DVVIQYIDAAHKGDPAVYNNDFAMQPSQTPQVETHMPQSDGLGSINSVLRTHTGEAIAYVVRAVVAAEAVDHDSPFDTAFACALQGLQDHFTAAVDVEDVGFEMDRPLGLVDGAAERRKVFSAVTEQVYTVTVVPFEPQFS